MVSVHYRENYGVESYSWSIQKITTGTAEHYAYHTGQVIFAAKLLQDEVVYLLHWKYYD